MDSRYRGTVQGRVGQVVWLGYKRQIDLLQASVIQVVEFSTVIMRAKDTVPLTLIVLHYLQRFVP